MNAWWFAVAVLGFFAAVRINDAWSLAWSDRYDDDDRYRITESRECSCGRLWCAYSDGSLGTVRPAPEETEAAKELLGLPTIDAGALRTGTL